MKLEIKKTNSIIKHFMTMCFIAHGLFSMSYFYKPGRASNLSGICLLFCFASFFYDMNKYGKEEKCATDYVLPVVLTSGHNEKPVVGLMHSLKIRFKVQYVDRRNQAQG